MREAALDIAEWLSLASAAGFALNSSLRVCETNYARPAVALAFLDRHPRATFAAIDFGNATRPERLQLEHSAVAARVTVYPGDSWRSVLAAPPLATAPCDVLVVGLREHASGSTEMQQRLLQDLPNAMRLASRRSLLLMHGAACPPAGAPPPEQPAPRAKGKRAKAAAVPVEQHWCRYWEALAESRAVLRGSCTTASPLHLSTTWCAGFVNTRSLCAGPHGGVAGGVEPLTLRSDAWRREVVSFGPRGSPGVGQWRYFSVLDCGPDGAAASELVCLLYKDKAHENAVMAAASADGLRFGAARLLAHKTWPFRITHNLAMLRHEPASSAGAAAGGAEYVMVGGQHRSGFRGSNGNHRGMWLVRGARWRALAASTRSAADSWQARPASGWRAMLLFNGSHPGCVERRDPALMPWSTMHAGLCEFDGRTSLAHLDGRYYLYVRANPAAHGQRFVQVTSSPDLYSWAPFRLLHFQGYRYAQGDVYTFAAQRSPVDAQSLVSVFPVTHLLQGCICVAASRDGVRWSRPTPLLGCAVNGERTVHHPVSGLLRRGEHVHLYVHENVMGITTSMMSVLPTLAKFRYLRLPTSRVVRYAIPAAAFELWTRRALRELDAHPRAHAKFVET